MKVTLKQIKNDLTLEQFEIIEDGKIIGNIDIKGSIASMEVKVNGNIKDFNFSMERAKHQKGKFRPYSIFEGEKYLGEVYQAYAKKTFFSEKIYKKCIINDIEYNSYGTTFPEKAINSIYKNDIQVSQYENSTTVYNELYVFDIYCIDENDLIPTLITALYGYIIALYEAGQKIIKSKRKKIIKVINKDWLDKHDPNWVEKNIK